jgi:8-oxo-dGTP pyrophosphatase MutT (NUDIX family)
MNRASLLALLDAYCRRYPDEAAVVARFERLLAEPRCFERDWWVPGHITGSAWLVDRAGTHVLLTHHRKLGRWLQLGGHADGDEHVLRVAMREATEESGLEVLPSSDDLLDVDIHQIPARGDEPAHFHFDLRFALRAAASDMFTVSDESHALRWVPIDEFAAFSDEASMLRMAAKWRMGRN